MTVDCEILNADGGTRCARRSPPGGIAEASNSQIDRIREVSPSKTEAD